MALADAEGMPSTQTFSLTRCLALAVLLTGCNMLTTADRLSIDYDQADEGNEATTSNGSGSGQQTSGVGGSASVSSTAAGDISATSGSGGCVCGALGASFDNALASLNVASSWTSRKGLAMAAVGCVRLASQTDHLQARTKQFDEKHFEQQIILANQRIWNAFAAERIFRTSLWRAVR